MKPFKNVFVILTLLFTALFIASCDGNGGDDKDSGTSGDSIVCTYYMKDDTSVYYVFYGDKTAEYHANGKIKNTRSELIYSGYPLKAGTVSLKISSTGTELISFNVKESNGTLIPTVELVPGFPVEYTLTLDGENNNGENEDKDKENQEGSGGNGENGNTENVNTCKWVLDADHSIYFIFYPDNTVEYYSYDNLEYDRSTLNYEGTPTEAGTVTIKVNTGVPLFTFTVTKNGSSVTATENNMGLTYTMAGDSSNNGESGNEENGGPEEPSTDIDESPLMFMGFENVVTIEKGTDITGITNTIYSLTSDTTLKFKGGINSITLTTIAAAISTNDSVKIALDFSEATGITEWTNKLAGVKTLYAISLPGTVTSVQDEAFKECTNLKAITVPKAITEFPSNLPNDIIINLTDDFWEWMKNPSIIPDGQTLYLNGEKLSNSAGSIIIPEGITTILDSAFEGCEWLITMTIPEGVKEIGNYAFKNCTNLTTITIPKSIQSFGEMAFRNCENLDKVYYKGTLETWLEVSTQDYVFYRFIELPGYDEDPWGGYWTWKDVDFYINGEIVTDVVIPDSVTSLRPYAFSDLRRNLKTVTIPDSVIYIGSSSFDCCTNLTKIHYKGTLETWLNNVLNHGFSLNAEIFYINNEKVTEITDVVIPDSVETIRDYAFYGWERLQTIKIPTTVKSIGTYAFGSCSSLTSITIPNSVTHIGDLAFARCSALTSITIPSGVTDINWGTFQNCKNLKNVTLPNTVSIIQTCAFFECESLTNITIPDSVTEIWNQAFLGCISLTSITIPDNVTSIGLGAFSQCSSLVSITIPSSVTSIGEAAFDYCDNLTTINYRGSEEQWAAINIDPNNTTLTTATIIYNYTDD